MATIDPDLAFYINEFTLNNLKDKGPRPMTFPRVDWGAGPSCFGPPPFDPHEFDYEVRWAARAASRTWTWMTNGGRVLSRDDGENGGNPRVNGGDSSSNDVMDIDPDGDGALFRVAVLDKLLEL